MNTMKTPLRRLTAGVGVLALATIGVLGTASMANADVGPGQPGAPTEGSLVIHKYAGSGTSQPADGTQQTINRPPLAGVTFEVTPIGMLAGGDCVPLDLGTAAGWTDAQAVALPVSAPYCLATAQTVSGDTDATGALTFPGLPLGLYYVDETAAPAGTTPSVEFLVTLPYANQSASTVDWLYTVYVYPKNNVDGDGSKTVGDATGHGLDSTVPWTLTSKPLGSFDDGAPLTSFSLIDNLDSRLTYAATPASTFTYTTPGSAPAAVAAANYSLSTPPGAGGTITAALTSDGIAWANTLPAGTRFTLSFSTTVTGVGDINNEAFQNSGGDDVTLGEASTQWGPAEILKHQAGDKAKTLQGAKFSVYDSVNGTDCTGTLGAALSVNGQTEFTSGANGIVSIAGLYVGKNNETASRVYCVVETQEPVGFVKDTTPRAITVKAEGTATTLAHIDVANTPVNGPILPMTGGDGALWFAVGGIALLLVAAGGLMMARRNQH